MRVSEVSKRYAKALLAVSKQKGIHAQVYGELQGVAKAFSQNADIQNYFENPLVAPEQKISVVKTALTGKGLSEEVLNTLVLLAENARLNVVPEISQAYSDLLDIEQGVTRGVVRSAQPLTADAQKEIETKIEGVLKKKIVLTYEQDSKLLGGVVATVGGWTFDDSIDTHIKKLNEELNRRAN